MNTAIFLAVALTTCWAFPSKPDRNDFRFPQVMTMGGYFGNPVLMSKGLISASFPETEDNEPESRLPEEEALEEGQEVVTEELIQTTTLKPKLKPKVKSVKTVKPKSYSEEEEEDSWPFGRRGGQSGYNVFFPIVFGERGSGSGSGSGYPRAATAIANSFNTGRGGVAYSHATAFGDPSMAAAFYRKNNHKNNKGQDE